MPARNLAAATNDVGSETRAARCKTAAPSRSEAGAQGTVITASLGVLWDVVEKGPYKAMTYQAPPL